MAHRRQRRDLCGARRPGRYRARPVRQSRRQPFQSRSNRRRIEGYRHRGNENRPFNRVQLLKRFRCGAFQRHRKVGGPPSCSRGSFSLPGNVGEWQIVVHIGDAASIWLPGLRIVCGFTVVFSLTETGTVPPPDPASRPQPGGITGLRRVPFVPAAVRIVRGAEPNRTKVAYVVIL